MMKGIPGGGNMMKKIQQMQQEMMTTQERISEQEFVAAAGGGVVTATVNGARKILKLDIQPDVVDPDDIDMLQDLVLAAINAALDNAEEEMANAMQKFTGGMPGLF